MWQRFTEVSRHAIVKAEQEAIKAQSTQVETEHLLLGLLDEADTTGALILRDYGVTAEKIRSEFMADSMSAGQEQKLSSPGIEELETRAQVDPALIRQLESQLLRKLRGQSEKTQLQLSPQVKRVLQLAADEAHQAQQKIKHSDGIGTEHLLLGLLRDESSSATETLNKLGLNLEQARIAVIKYLQ